MEHNTSEQDGRGKESADNLGSDFSLDVYEISFKSWKLRLRNTEIVLFGWTDVSRGFGNGFHRFHLIALCLGKQPWICDWLEIQM